MFTYLTENQNVRDDRKDRELLVMGIGSTSGDGTSKGTQCMYQSISKLVFLSIFCRSSTEHISRGYLNRSR